jgi:hypothetical protein
MSVEVVVMSLNYHPLHTSEGETFSSKVVHRMISCALHTMKYSKSTPAKIAVDRRKSPAARLVRFALATFVVINIIARYPSFPS